MVFSTTSYLIAVLPCFESGAGGCETMIRLRESQDPLSTPSFETSARSKFAIEQISAAVRSAIGGFSASSPAVASTAARSAAEVVASTRRPITTKCSSDRLARGGRVIVFT